MFEIGDLIDRKYRLKKDIGRGTSSEVFLAWDELQERFVALKTYTARLETAQRESVLLTRLAGKRKKHVVEIYGANYTDDSQRHRYLAEQYIEGMTLDAWQEGKSLEERLGMALQVAEGLKNVHEEGVTHNDVKPSNIMVDENKVAHLIDFGVSLSDSLIWPTTRGSKSYAAPEKFDNPELTEARADIYAWGAMAYELLTRQLPIAVDKNNLAESIRKVKEEVPRRPRELNPAISEDIERIIMRGLEKKPEDRFKDGQELFEQLDGAVNKRIVYVVEKYKEVKVEDEEGMKKMAGELLVSLFRNKIAPLVEEGKIPVGQFPYGIQKGRNEWFLTDARYWTAGFWPGILWLGYEATGEERFRKWAEEWTRDLDIEFEDRFKLNVLGAKAYYGYVPAFEITGKEWYLKKILEAVEEIKKGFDSERGFIQVDRENPDWIYASVMESCLPLLVWAGDKSKDERLKQMIDSQVNSAIKYLLREDNSVRYIAEIAAKTGEILKDINGVSRNPISRRAREQARMMFGLSLVDGFKEEKERVRSYFLENLPEDGVACYDLNDANVSDAVKDASASALIVSGLLKNGFRHESWKIIQSLVFKDYLTKDEKYKGILMHGCVNINEATFIDSALVYGDYYFLKNLKKIKKN